MAVAAKNTKVSKATQKKENTTYTKEQLLSSEKFRNRRDLTDAILESGKRYTQEEAEQMMSKYLKGKVR